MLWGGRCVQAQDNLPARGDSLVKEKKFDEALKLYQKALSTDTGNSAILEKISEAKGLKKQAAENYQEALLKGQQYLSAKEYKKAIEAFKTALDHKPEATYPRLKLDEIRQKYEDPQEKLQYKQYVQKADSLMEKFNYEKALTFYNKALEIKPRQVDLLKKTKQLNNFIKKQDQRGKDYDKIIAQAEELYDNQQYQQAMSKYQQASVIKPDKKLPGQKIQAIRKQLQKEEQKNELYQNLVDKADSLYMERQFEKAKTAYKEALSIKPSESYPVNMIGKIDPALAQKQEMQNEYKRLINKGDIAFRNENYQDAISLYQEASQKKPSKNYPKEQIAKINELEEKIAIRKNRDKAYSELLAQADRMMQTDNLREARQAYRKALEIYSEKTYPKEQLQIISERVQQLNNQMAAYENYLSTADSLFEAENYSEAISYYQNALNYTDTKSYPESRIAQSRKMLAAGKAKEQKYQATITKADSLYQNKIYAKAREHYKKALEIKTNDSYAQDQLANIEDALNTYNSALARGDRNYKNEEYEAALQQYQKAAQIKPGEDTLANKISDTKQILEEIHQKMMEKYNKVIADADEKYKNKKFSEAIDAYEEAARINDEADYPEDKISQINKYLKEHSLRKVITQNTTIADGAEKQFSFNPLGYRDRSQNFIVIEATGENNKSPKVFLNYGQGDSKNGGVVIPSVSASTTKQYIINLSEHNRWYDNENNWISLYVQDGELKILNMSIVKGD